MSSGARVSASVTWLRKRITIRVSGESRPEWEIEGSGLQTRPAARILSRGEADDSAVSGRGPSDERRLLRRSKDGGAGTVYEVIVTRRADDVRSI